MGLKAIPADLASRYQFKEWNHAAAILADGAGANINWVG